MQTNNKLFCSRLVLRQGIDRLRLASVLAVLTVSLLSWTAAARAGDAPAWMHALVNVPLPEHDEKTDAVLLYSGRFVLVQSAEKIKITVREAFKILRPSGREYGTLVVPYNSHQKITAMRADHGCEGQTPSHSGRGPGQHRGVRIRKRRSAIRFTRYLAFPARKPRPRSTVQPSTSLRLGIQSKVDELSGDKARRIRKPI